MNTKSLALFAPVAPIQILLELWEVRELGAYHLFLAHHTVEHPEAFKNLISHITRSTRYADPLIIMDNSLVECGFAVDTQMCLEAANIISDKRVYGNTKVVSVLPDVMGDAAATLEATASAYEEWVDKMPGQLMVVAQPGKLTDPSRSFMDNKPMEGFKNLINFFFILHKEEYSGIGWVGIPRSIQTMCGLSREWAVRYVQMVAPHVQIHLLGFSNDIEDDMRCARIPGIRGIDSAVPVRYDGVLTPTTSDSEIGPRGNWMEEGHLNRQNLANIQNVRSWIQER